MTIGEALSVLHPDWSPDQVDAEARRIAAENKAGKAVPSTAGGGPRDFSAEVGSHFAQPAAVPALALGRASLLRRVGDLVAGGFLAATFDCRDVKRWIDTALDGDAGRLRDLDGELTSQEED